MAPKKTASSQLPLGSSGRTPLAVMLEAAEEAGVLMRERFRSDLKVVSKGRGNIVTDLDSLIEERTIRLLRQEFPSFGILAEESDQVPSDSGYTWVIDPLDGTRNYASGLPFFSTVIALAHGQEVLLGLTYDPMRNELFLAEKGKGATLNGEKIHVTRRARVQDGIMGFDMGYHDERAKNALELMVRLWPGMQSIRIMGSAALGMAYAASGRIDVYFHHMLFPWDIASGILLVKEAGGEVTEKDGSLATIFSESIIASSPALHSEFLCLSEGSDWRR